MKQNIYDNETFNKEYDKMRNDNKGMSANDVIEIPIFRKLLPDLNDKNILDLGCGYGENDLYFSKMGAKYVLGTDISTHMIDIANRDYKLDNIDYKVMAMEDISSIDRKFDIVVSSLAFHYVKEFDKLLFDINNLLNDNGYLVFSQEHPIADCVIIDDKIKSNHINIGDKKFALVSDYNREGIRIHHWNGCDVNKYYRNFSTIINSLIKNGFIIDEINECEPNEEMISKNSKYANQYDYPYYLFVKAHKNNIEKEVL